MPQQIADLRAGDLLRQAVRIFKLFAKRRITIHQETKIFAMNQRAAFNEGVLVGEIQLLARAHRQIQPVFIVCQYKGGFGGQRFGHFIPKLRDHRTRKIPDVRIIHPDQKGGQPERRHPEQRGQPEVERAQEAGGAAPAIGHFLAEYQQNVAAEIADAQRRQIVKSQKRRPSRANAQAHVPRAGACLDIEEHRNPDRQKHDMQHPKQDARQVMRGGAQFALERRPVDGGKEERHQGRGSGDKGIKPGQTCQIYFLLGQFLMQQFPKTAVMVNDPQKRNQPVEQQSQHPPTGHAQDESPVEKTDAFDPDQRQQKTRKEPDQSPIVRHAQPINKGQQVQPPLALRNSILQQAKDEEGEDQ